MMLKKFFVFSCLFFLVWPATAQNKRQQEGYTFSSTIPEWKDQTGFDQWVFQSSYSTCVRLTIPFALIDTTFYITKNTSIKLRVDSIAGISGLDRFDSIHNVFGFVQSKFPISLIKNSTPETNGFGGRRSKTLFPTHNFSLQSMLLHGRYNNPADGSCGIYVHSLANNNLISIKPYHPLIFKQTPDTSKYFATRIKTGQVVLDSGETIMLQVHVWNDMYLGASKTVITSSKPHIASIWDGGNLYNQFVPAYPCSPINLQFGTSLPTFQNKPLHLARQYYPFSPINKQGKDYIHLLATQPNTSLYYNGQFVATLDSLELWDTCFYDAGIISTDKPIMFGQFVQRNAQNAQPYEMFGIEVQTSDTSEYIHKTIFDATQNTLIGDTSAFRLNIIAYTQDTMLLKHNGAALQNVSWQAFSGNPNLSWCTYQVTDGTHILESTSKFSALYYPQRYIKNPYRQEELSSYMLQGVTPTQEAADSVQFYYLNQNGQKEPWANCPVTACAGIALTLYPNIARHTTWQWAFGDGTTQTQRIGNQRAKPISHTWPNPGQYWLTVTDSAGCSAGDSLLVVVENGPAAAFSYTTNTGCSGTFVQLQNESLGANSYQWQWPGGSSTATNPGFVYTGQDSTLTVTLIATDGICSDTLTQIISIQHSAFNIHDVPNVFTPNNDGVNDAFCIPNTAGYQDCYKLEVFNRWGSIVYQSYNPQDCWQPQSNIASGVYFYVLTLGKQEYTGQVTVF
jgi:gliding motility-associated-like protein